MATAKHYLEQELEELISSSTKTWEFIRSGSLDGVWYWDLENPDQEYMSPEFWHLFGFDPETKKHQVDEWQDLIFAEDLPMVQENLEKHLADPDHPYDQVVRYKTADGSVKWVRCRGMAIRDENGKPTRLLGAHNDITQQMHSEIEAEAISEELETVFNAATCGIIAFDREHKIRRINGHARHMLGGLSTPVPFDWPEEIKFLDSETLQPQAKKLDPLTRALAGEPIQSETHLMRRVQSGDDRRYLRVNSAVVSNEGPIHAVLVLDDISIEERNRQVVERKSRLDALGQLTGGIAHDFNNLLASLLYAVDLAKMSKDTEKQEKYLEIAKSSIKRGRALTSRLLSFARKQPGLATVKTTKSVFDAFEELVSPMIEAQIEINFHVDDPELRHYCDQTQLETAMMNLVLNSRDAILRSGDGNRVDIRARPVRSPNVELDLSQSDPKTAKSIADAADEKSNFRYVEISVTDNGPGMDEETTKRSTDPFFTTKNTNSGTGLGLAMVYGFLRQANGDLKIYSEVGVGTTVQLTLPRGSKEGLREVRMPDDIVPLGKGETLLVVEDENQLLLMISAVLEGLGYRVVSAISGEDAMAKHEAGEHFDLLLSDVVMPGKIGGFELARLLRKEIPDLPVIYMSGYTGFTPSEMGEVQAPLLQKPAPPEELAEAIAHALDAVRD